MDPPLRSSLLLFKVSAAAIALLPLLLQFLLLVILLRPLSVFMLLIFVLLVGRAGDCAVGGGQAGGCDCCGGLSCVGVLEIKLVCT